MRFLSSFTLCSAIALSACTQTSSTQSALSGSGSSFPLASFFTKTGQKTRVNGYVFDPEAFLWSMNTDPNGGPPQLSLDTPNLDRALVHNAQVTVIDSTNGDAITDTPVATDLYGSFATDANSNDALPYLMSVTADSGTLDQPQPTNPFTPPYGPEAMPLPPGQYLPTVMLRRVNTHQTYCYVEAVPVASNAGILQAVAKFRSTVLGVPTTVNDFLDPNQFGGVIIWVRMPQFPWQLWSTAMGTSGGASVGDTFDIAWTMPGDPNLPPEAVAIQSDRGFLVSPDPSFNLGISVTLLPPSSGPTTVTLSGQDNDTTDPGRPFTYSDISYTVFPGVISYGYEMPDLPADRVVMGPTGPVALPLPDAWRCVPDINQDL